MIGWIRRFNTRLKERQRAGETRPDLSLIAFLVGQISVPRRAESVLGAVASFQKQLPAEQADELPRIYLLLEQYLTEVDPLRKYTRHQLREDVRDQFPSLMSSEPFSLIFEGLPRQNVLLCRAFVVEALRRAVLLLGASGDNFLVSAREWVLAIPSEVTFPAPLGIAEESPSTDQDWVSVLIQLSHAIYQHLERSLGEAGDRIYESTYRDLARRYMGLEAFPVVIRLLPDKLLDEHKIQYLARDGALRRVQGALSVAQTAALESGAQLQAVLNAVGEGILTADAEGFIVLANREVEHTFGYARAELVGIELTELFTSTSLATSEMRLKSLGETHTWENLGQRVEAEGTRKDGSVFPLEIRIDQTEIGGRLFYTAAVRDITERKRFERELVAAKERAEEMARLKDAFLANMSHEIRTPLAAIIGYADVLAEDFPGEGKELVQMIHKGGRRLMETLNSVLDLAQLESGSLHTRPEVLDLYEAVYDAVEIFQRHAEERSLSLQLIRPPGPVRAELDRAALGRVLNNILSNAIKFTDEGGVTVSIGTDSHDAWIYVEDTGIGISPEFIPCLFDEFRQESTGHTRSHEGNGLGLTITKRLVDLMGGGITVVSEKGKGSTFIVRFRTHDSKPETTPASSSYLGGA